MAGVAEQDESEGNKSPFSTFVLFCFGFGFFWFFFKKEGSSNS